MCARTARSNPVGEVILGIELLELRATTRWGGWPDRPWFEPRSSDDDPPEIGHQSVDRKRDPAMKIRSRSPVISKARARRRSRDVRDFARGCRRFECGRCCRGTRCRGPGKDVDGRPAQFSPWWRAASEVDPAALLVFRREPFPSDRSSGPFDARGHVLVPGRTDEWIAIARARQIVRRHAALAARIREAEPVR